ncbi:palmitoyl-protein thioesterase 1-like [Sycon ciliatum]|uniref:Palmitoyl-protein thioesterase 1 n=1 Tax=Sycon ciliatum TaxID=27933 RepID=M1XMU0_9METZ|nr:Palmitoyl protein thioesterase [Sycon ciliatum]|eukprot:scpid81874/ scgid7024/ Palmitoyl-protein thioesterase 1; Palmitoyl-protein hydrolase 1
MCFRSLSALVLVLAACSHVSQAVLPIVMWHGMGDSCCNPLSMGSIKKAFESALPGVYVRSLEIGDSVVKDTENGFLMNANDQITQVCAKLKQDPKLADGFNAIGFSQGGQFLRAVAQRCPEPQMHNLVSVGGQHQGVYGFPRCPGANSTLCEIMRKLLDVGAYVSFVQDHLVQAEYWQDPFHYDEYVEKNVFLADINNEKTYNAAYKTNLQKLSNLVLVRFMRDTMVQPSISEWFGFYKPNSDKETVSMKDTRVYQKDLLGLQEMEAAGKIHFLASDSDHLQMNQTFFEEQIMPWFK